MANFSRRERTTRYVEYLHRKGDCVGELYKALSTAWSEYCRLTGKTADGNWMLERIAEIQARVDVTTEGPWFYNSYNGIFSGPKMRTYDAWFDTLPAGHTLERRDECPPCGEWKEPRFAPSPGVGHGCRFFSEDYDRDPEIASVPSHHGDTAIGKRAADAQFMADARQDVPWLLEQVQVLQDRIAKLREICNDRRAESAFGSWADVEEIWPSEILSVLDGEGEKAERLNDLGDSTEDAAYDNKEIGS